MGRSVLVAAAVIESGSKFLIAKRKGGAWEFPGGKVERDETPEEALAREIREELGCKIRVGGIFEIGCAESRGKRFIILFYNCSLASGKIAAKEHEKVEWVARADLKKYRFGSADRKAAAKLSLARDRSNRVRLRKGRTR